MTHNPAGLAAPRGHAAPGRQSLLLQRARVRARSRRSTGATSKAACRRTWSSPRSTTRRRGSCSSRCSASRRSLGLRDFALRAVGARAGRDQPAGVSGRRRPALHDGEPRGADPRSTPRAPPGSRSRTFGVGASVQWIHVPRLRYQLVIDANPFPGDVNPVASELDMLATVTGSDPVHVQRDRSARGGGRCRSSSSRSRGT